MDAQVLHFNFSTFAELIRFHKNMFLRTEGADPKYLILTSIGLMQLKSEMRHIAVIPADERDHFLGMKIVKTRSALKNNFDLGF